MPTINCTDCYRPLVEFQPFALLSRSIHVVVGLLLSQGCMAEFLTLDGIPLAAKAVFIERLCTGLNCCQLTVGDLGDDWCWMMRSVVCRWHNPHCNTVWLWRVNFRCFIRIWLMIIDLWACSPCSIVRTNESTVETFVGLWGFLTDNLLFKFEFVFLFHKKVQLQFQMILHAADPDFAQKYTHVCSQHGSLHKFQKILKGSSPFVTELGWNVTYLNCHRWPCKLFEWNAFHHICASTSAFIWLRLEVDQFLLSLVLKFTVCELAVHNKHSQKLVLWLTCV